MVGTTNDGYTGIHERKHEIRGLASTKWFLFSLHVFHIECNRMVRNVPTQLYFINDQNCVSLPNAPNLVHAVPATESLCNTRSTNTPNAVLLLKQSRNASILVNKERRDQPTLSS